MLRRPGPFRFAICCSSYSGTLFVILQQRKHMDAGELGAAVEEREFDGEGCPRYFAPELLDELDGGCGGAAGCEQIVAKQDSLARLDRVFVKFKLVGAVFQLIGDRGSFAGKLFGFAHRNEAGAEAIGERGGKDEAAGFDAGDDVHFSAVVLIAELINQRMETGRILEQGGEVVE